MRKLVYFGTFLLVGGLLVSSAYAGGKIAGVDQKGMAVKAAPANVEVVKGSLLDAVRAYFSTHFGVSIIKDRSKEPSKPNEPQKGWGHYGRFGEYVLIKDHGIIDVSN